MDDTRSMPIPRDLCLEFVEVPMKGDLAFRSVAVNDVETLSRILEEGYEIDTRHPEDSHFETAFAVKDDSRMLSRLSLKGFSMLHVAIVHANLEMINYLISKGADINFLEYGGASPLSLSVLLQRPDVTQILIDSGADVNIQNPCNGRTPLIEACTNGCLPIVKKLIKAGCDLDLANRYGTTPMLACMHYFDRNVKAKKRALHYLIRGGAKVDRPDKKGVTALMRADELGLKDIVTALLEAGADSNLSDKSERTVAQSTDKRGSRLKPSLRRQTSF